MAITINSITVGPTDGRGKTPFVVDFYSLDVTGNEIIKSAGTGVDLYLEKIQFEAPSMSLGEWVHINDDTTLTLGPILSGDPGAGGGIGMKYKKDFKYPIKFDTSINIDTEATDPIHGTIEGFTVG